MRRAAITTNIELLAPAGSPEALDAAIGEGADAVYLGLKEFNARMRSANFTYSQFEAALRALHRMGRKVYVTVNTVFEQREAGRVFTLLKYLNGLGPDGILVQDFGIITLARENFPSLKLHASTQMNVSSGRGVNLLSKHGFSRVVLARELSLGEIQDIRANTNMELEVFVHGALCVSVSGICLFSSYLGGKSANRGMCTQACRRFYTAYSGKGLEDLAADGGAAGGNTGGGYYFSPSDLELIGEIPALVKAGVNSFKIEGRMKSAEYVGTVVSAYRLVIDNLEAGEDALRNAIEKARAILKNDFARPKTSYLLHAGDMAGGAGISAGNFADGKVADVAGSDTGAAREDSFNWLNPEQSGGTGIPLGKLLKVRGRDDTREGLVSGGAVAPSPGDSIRLHKADDSDRVSHKIRAVENDRNGESWISVPEGFEPGDAVYLIQTRAMTKRYPPVIGRVEKSRGTGRSNAPPPRMDAAGPREAKGAGGGGSAGKTGEKRKAGGGRKAETGFPGGIYAMVSRIEDMYILQSSRPVKVILTYSRKTVRQLLGARETPLPFPPRDIIISLDPFFPQEKEPELAEAVPALMEKGYTRFIVNNLGHFSLFQKPLPGPNGSSDSATLIAGPWLYTFNEWAWNFIARCGAEYCVSPLENNRQNLEKTFYRDGNSPHRRGKVFLTIFSRPSLFRIRPNLGAALNFANFSGSRGEAFRLAPAPEGTLVFPGEPFSIIDKTPFLKEAGFSCFILDFSSGPLKKNEYREIMEAVNKAAPLPGANRFNWKNGFFNPTEPAAPSRNA